MNKEAKETTTNYKVPNLERGLEIMELLADNPKGLSIQDIKNELGLSQTSVFRITQSLLQKGYLARDEESKYFYLTRKLLTIGFRAINEHDLLEIALPWMRKLRDEVKETVFLGIIGDTDGIFIEQALGTYPFKFMLTPGNRFPFHCSAPGKAMLAFLPEKEKVELVSKLTLKKFNENTITTKRKFQEELKMVKEQGYALDREEQLKGVVCVGAPVFDYQGFPKAAIWISGPTERMNEVVWEDQGELVKQYAEKISIEMGYKKN
ncbi:IclR family transcriptional regulator [Puteibacter caeruleilacunae]|nr:IclR family transcriptional regulator [Puteibacter caeruleilacunae]